MNEISNRLLEMVKDLTGEDVEVQVEIPSDLTNGDYTTNVALTLFAKLKTQNSKLKTPMELADKIVDLLNTKYQIQNTFRLIEAKPPGFINFWLSKEAISRQVGEVLHSSEKLVPATKSELSELIFEFGDPNPFKEPHIGHLRNLVLGEAIGRLIESGGTKVIRANYQGDVGLHVAKCIWGILHISRLPKPGTGGQAKIIPTNSIRAGSRLKTISGKNQILNLGNEDVEKGAKALGEAYVFGAEKFESDEEAKKEIISINKKIYSGDSELYSLWQKGRDLSLDYFEQLYKKLDIKYDKYYFESQTAPVGVKIVEENSPEIFEKHEGALIFRGEDFGLHTRVFVTTEGHATYEGKDLALAVLKDQDFPEVNKSIIMTANEQVEYFKVLLAALKLVDPEIAEKTSHLSFGFVNLKEGKMSSRSGNVVSAFWLLDEVRKRLKNGFKEVSEEVLDDLSAGAVKWSMLKFSRESNISFSIDESIQIEGNSGPYMQYAYARIASLLQKGKDIDWQARADVDWQGQELALGRLICQFENVKNSAEETFSPNILTNYLFNLAQNFNQFYEKEKVIGSSREEEKLVIVNAVGKILKTGLYLLGIASPEKI